MLGATYQKTEERRVKAERAVIENCIVAGTRDWLVVEEGVGVRS